MARGRLAGEIVGARLDRFGPPTRERRTELIGLDSVLPLSPAEPPPPDPREVRLRVAARVASREEAERIGQEVESLYLCGPAGGGGVTRSLREVVAIASTLISGDEIEASVHLEDA